VKAAVLSKAVTTKLPVPCLACPLDSSGGWSPPGLPSAEPALEPFTVMLSVMLIGSALGFSKVRLVRWNRESPFNIGFTVFGKGRQGKRQPQKRQTANLNLHGSIPPSLGESTQGRAGGLARSRKTREISGKEKGRKVQKMCAG
jgi:hypothetical protein